jgi:hypothetical protein
MKDIEVLVEIQESLRRIESKLEKSSVGSFILVDDDLIGRFFNELSRYQIDCSRIVDCYDDEDVRNKASYYFEHITTINAPRQYLLKLVSQLKTNSVAGVQSYTSSSAPTTPEDIEKADLVSRFREISIKQFHELVAKHSGLAVIAQGQGYSSCSPVVRAMAVRYAIEDGLL